MVNQINHVILHSTRTQNENLLRFTDMIINSSQLEDLLNNTLALLPSMVRGDSFMILANHEDGRNHHVYQTGLSDGEYERFNYITKKSKIWNAFTQSKRTLTNRTLYKDQEFEKTEDYRVLLKPNKRFHFAVSPILLQDQIGASIHIVRGTEEPFSAHELNRVQLISHYLSFGMRSLPKRTIEQKSHVQLTKREHEVLQLLSEGIKVADLSEELGISYYTAKDHLKNIYRKLGVSSRSEASMFALKHGLLQIP
jgi:DNA-binding CsgD family transcriptional regulator